MDDVAITAGVTKPLLYQHFSSKRDLYVELVDGVAKELFDAIVAATAAARGPREQVEEGLAAFFGMVVSQRTAFRLLYGQGRPSQPEARDALRRVEQALVDTIDPLIDAGLDPDHRRFLAAAMVGMAEGASRHWLERLAQSADSHETGDPEAGARGTPPARGPCAGEEREAQLLARRLADLAWAGLRAVHPS